MKNFRKFLILMISAALLLTLTACELAEDGADGESAYQIAVRNGFTGSEAEWLASLNGTNGNNGENGEDGIDGKDGVDGEDGKPGLDGADGDDGVGVEKIELDENGYLIVTLTNGAVVNAGYVGIATPDTSTEAPKLNATSLNIPMGNAYIFTSDRPNTTFSSSDPSIAQVSPEGLLLAVGEGTATVTATSRDGKTSSCTVNSLAYTYKKLTNDTVKITGYNGSLTELNIPDNIMGMTVTEIGEGAFADYSDESKITAVLLPDSVTSIGSYAFNSLNNLVSVKFGKALNYIGFNAFSGCEKLTGVILPETLEALGNAAFNMCESLTEIVIPSGISEIPGSAFYGCEKLTSVTIGSGVKSIGYSAFEFCTSLTEIVIPSQVIFVDEYAFANCEKLAAVTIEGAFIYDANTSFLNTPWYDANKETVTPGDNFIACNDDTEIYATIVDAEGNDVHAEGEDVNIYLAPNKESIAGSLKDGTAVKRIGVYYEREDDHTYGWSKIEVNVDDEIKIYYVRNSQIKIEMVKEDTSL